MDLQFGDAEAVAAADMDGDGLDEPVLVRAGVAYWRDHTVALGGEVQQVARGDVDGDGHEEALLATGVSRSQPDAPARLWALGPGGAELLWERAGPRCQVTDLRWLGRVWLAAFVDSRQVEAGWLNDGVLEIVSRGSLATRHLPWQDGVLVGRIYGDEPRSDGDLRWNGPDGTVTTLPTLRGVRDLESADMDGDGVAELLVSDGWHYAYGERALARVQLLRGPDWSDGRTIGFFKGEYSVEELQVAGQGAAARVLALGNARVHLLQRDALGWADRDLGPLAEHGSAVFLTTQQGLGVLVAGAPARFVPVGP